MTETFKKFLTDDVRRLAPNGRFLGLAAFGKHPGWDDHVEDLGLETDSLNQAKSVFYVNGIGGQIDAGAWEKLDSSQQLPGFNHLFLWQRSGQIILGRLWSSSDGKGRKRYPMVVCFHFAGIPLHQALLSGLPALAELEQQIQATTSAEDVRSILNRKRAALRESLAAPGNGGEYAPLSIDKLRSILREGQSLGFIRVLYQMQSQFKTFAPGTFNPKNRGGSVRAQQIRVPAASDNPQDAFLFWTRFFAAQIDASVPLLFCLPLEGNWMDVTAGDPESHEFFALRASPKSVPLVSEVPYTLDESFQSQARSFLDSLEKGESPAPVVAAADPSTATSGSGRPGWLKWLGVGAIIVIAGGAGAFLYLSKSGKCAVDPHAAGSAAPSTNVQATAPAAPAQTSFPVVPSAAKMPVTTPAPANAVQPETPPAPKTSNDKPATVSETQPTSQPAASSFSAIVTQAIAVAKSNASAANAAPPVADKSDRLAPAPVSSGSASESVNEASAKAVAFAGVSTTQTTPAPIELAAPAKPSSGALMTNSIGMVFVRMPSGFWAGKYEVTRAEYSRLMQGASNDEPGAALPVNRVSWDDANAFCSKLSQKEAADLHGKLYALPTQRQWDELRGGQKLEDLPAGALKTASQEPAVVSETASNKLGLYGVLGNVWEWSRDGGNDTAKLQKGGEYNSSSFDRLVTGGKARLNSGFRVVLVQQ